MHLEILPHRTPTNIKCQRKNKKMINKAKMVVFLKSIISYIPFLAYLTESTLNTLYYIPTEITFPLAEK